MKIFLIFLLGKFPEYLGLADQISKHLQIKVLAFFGLKYLGFQLFMLKKEGAHFGQELRQKITPLLPYSLQRFSPLINHIVIIKTL